MQVYNEPMNNWTLFINDTVRARDIILPSSWDQDTVFEYIVTTHKNREKWGQRYENIEMRFRMKCKPIEVAHRKMVSKVSYTETKKGFCKPCITSKVEFHYITRKADSKP